MKYFVYVFSWTEYERGWGARPDGISFYRTKEAALEHKKRVQTLTDPTYFTVTDQPEPIIVEVTKSTYEACGSGYAWSNFMDIRKFAEHEYKFVQASK